MVAEGGAKIFEVFRVKNHDFTPKNLIFSNFRGARAGCAPPPPPPPPPYRNVIPLCKLLIILCGFYMTNNNSYTAHFVPVSFAYSI
jgi:hypothetical protein